MKNIGYSHQRWMSNEVWPSNSDADVRRATQVSPAFHFPAVCRCRIVVSSLRRAILFRVNHILLSFALAGLVWASGPNPHSNGNDSHSGKRNGHGHAYGHYRQDRAHNGNYTAVVGGFYLGGGT